MHDVIAPLAQSVLTFWFETLTPEQWFRKDPALDATLRERFLSLHGDVAAGAHDGWLAAPRSRLAYIIVLDQFSRNMFRGDAKGFAFDALALRATEDGIALGMDAGLGRAEKQFFYLPMMHAESLPVQERSLPLFEPLGVGDFARRHRDIIARFGRFPHRNAALGRSSSEEEAQFVATTPGF